MTSGKRNYLGRDFQKKREEDQLSKKERSSLMSKISSKGTRFEKDFIKRLRKEVDKNFEIHAREIKGTPDIVFKEDKVCIFLDSDFWHGWQYPRWKHLLKNDFWREKIERNRNRDRNTTRYLRRRGWKVLRLWEHQINEDIDVCVKKIKTSINN